MKWSISWFVLLVGISLLSIFFIFDGIAFAQLLPPPPPPPPASSPTPTAQAPAGATTFFFENCNWNNGTVCSGMTHSLAQNATGIDPNYTVQLGFFVVDAATKLVAPSCPNGKTLFNALRFYTDSTGSAYVYLTTGAGAALAHTFNSGADQQLNWYVGYFYCGTSQIPISDPAFFDSAFNTLAAGSPGTTWITPEFKLLTRIVTLNVNCNGSTGQGPVVSSCVNYVTRNDCENNLCSFSPACVWNDANALCNIGTTGGVIPPIVVGSFAFGSAVIPNLLSANTVGEFFALLIDLLIFLGFIGTGFFIVYGGIMMMLSLGNEERLRTAKSIITWAVMGFVILLMAKVFILIIKNFVG